MRSAEDCGSEAAILPQSFDTHMPLNVNDADLDANTLDVLPKNGCGYTEMSFSLILIEALSTLMSMKAWLPGCVCEPPKTQEEIRQLVSDYSERIYKRFFSTGFSSVPAPLVRLSRLTAKVLGTKMEMMLQVHSDSWYRQRARATRRVFSTRGQTSGV